MNEVLSREKPLFFLNDHSNPTKYYYFTNPLWNQTNQPTGLTTYEILNVKRNLFNVVRCEELIPLYVFLVSLNITLYFENGKYTQCAENTHLCSYSWMFFMLQTISGR